jgi:hypothetical protein
VSVSRQEMVVRAVHFGSMDEHEGYGAEKGEEESDHGLRRNVLVLF